MSYHKCPACSEKLNVTFLSNNTVFSCESCGLYYKSNSKDENISYVELCTNYDTEIRRRGIKKQLANSGIRFDDLPPIVKSILSTKKDYIADYRLLRAEEPEFGGYVKDSNLPEGLIKALEENGIKRFYKFQEEAMEKILKGENVIIKSPTASGKTEAFALPIFYKIIQKYRKHVPKKRRVSALFIYPTVPLCQNQFEKLQKLAKYENIKIDILVGPTPEDKRNSIRRNPPDILITNFDLIHYNLIKRNYLHNLISSVKFVVIDEIHVYTGIFGANVYFILKRLKRLIRDFQIIGSSATIGNAKEFAELLFDSPVSLVECNAGKHGDTHFMMLYPSFNKSVNSMIIDILKACVKNRLKTLVFCNSHHSAEILNLMAQRQRIKSNIHRGGLSYEHRKKVEKDFKEGKLDVVISTPTLELGIDIGDVDAVISEVIGITNFIQRKGRAGRRGQENIAIVALKNDDPISLYYKNHPSDYFGDISLAYIEPKNPIVARFQILSASLDKELTKDEFPEYSNILDSLIKEKLLEDRGEYISPVRVELGGAKLTMSEVRKFNIRGIGDIMEIDEGDKKIGFREMPLACRELFPGAVYLHGGNKYKSVEFNSNEGWVTVKRLPKNHKYITQALRTSIPKILKIIETNIVFGIYVYYCDLNITEIVYGYTERRIDSMTVVKKYSLDRPISYSFDTKGFVFKAPPPASISDLDGSFHAVEHILIESSDMLTGGGSREIGGISMGSSGVIFVYDGCKGGSGLSYLLYTRLKEAFKRSLIILKECKCKSESGCPSCTYSYQCGNNNQPLSKKGAIESLEKIIWGLKTSFSTRDYLGVQGYV